MAAGEWEIYVIDEVREWITQLDEANYRRVVQAIDVLADIGPSLGRSLGRYDRRLVDTQLEGTSAGHGSHPVCIRPLASLRTAGRG
ncbi:hypothetical protein [Nocardia mexicana]|uniref:hypothetical protein n=1 Tax=Nocardia mexicana TaxID=279262 RepID=UPI001FE8003B|nr:hypothetical protein [Nocardia mexicana]